MKRCVLLMAAFAFVATVPARAAEGPGRGRSATRHALRKTPPINMATNRATIATASRSAWMAAVSTCF